jgi:hypothetical protein
MLDKNVIDIDADGPEKEQAGDEYERHDITFFRQWG